MSFPLFPDNYVDSVYNIDFNKLKNLGYYNIIFDIDNTLVEHGAPSDKRSENLFKELKEQGFNTCLISNNYKERVDIFNKDICSLYISEAKKPSKKGFYRALSIMNAEVDNTVFIGDQIFTDILGAKLVGIYSILTKPIKYDFEKFIIFKRKLEKIVLFFYKFKRKPIKITKDE